ncbi:hypothetical protein LOTGIDRAFT_239013 [Lottia gigantea]|uniref:EGF-like domain-containing protein n=1 Tax=Lottia gigantea TaxID=225164 RepID=V4A3T7_LOTGI|nr:hypothetical protein LOTGIDRAFT_239013 [Lottia gigantea]ESO98568.1 hypothetical protein LOTGIDRAFT_239013 [Lottia gigantea]
MIRPPELFKIYQGLFLLLLIHSRHEVRGVTDTTLNPTTSLPPVRDVFLDPPGITCDSFPDHCKNNGTCRQLLDDELWECSGDVGTGPLKCICPPTHTGSRCETKLTCDSMACLSTEVCDYNWNKRELECIPKNTSGQPPTCRPGVQEIKFQVDRTNLPKKIVCLPMYSFNASSLCRDEDDSLTYLISEPPPELPHLFCLVVDYQTYQTCLRINATHRDSINMTSVEVTIKAEEYSVLERSAPLKLRIIFNTPPSVQNSVIQWVVNTADTMSLDVIQEAQVTSQTELQISHFSLSNENIVTALITNKSFLQLSLKGTPTFEIKKLQATVKITDTGIPRLTTTVIIQITLVRLDCQPINTLLIDKRNMVTVGTPFPVGQIECRGTTGYRLNYDSPQSGIIPGSSISVNSANEIMVKVNEALPSRLPETGSSRLIVSFNKLRKVLNFDFEISYYSLIWFESEATKFSLLEIETEIIKHLSAKVSIKFSRIRDVNWVDILLKSNVQSSYNYINYYIICRDRCKLG